MSMRTKEQQANFHAFTLNGGDCAATGPWGAVCTSDPGHDYSHYDANLDVSFNSRWHEDMDVPLDNHPFNCECEECKP